MILPTLWSGPWIWREQRSLFAAAATATATATATNVFEVDDAVVNWPIESTFEAAEAYCLDKLAGVPTPYTLAGASFGGFLALRLALHWPERVDHVIASGCPGLGGRVDLGFDLRGLFSLTPNAAQLARAALFRDVTCVTDEEVQAAASAVANGRAIRRGARLIRALQSYDVAADLRRLAVPVSLIWGADDLLAPVGPWLSLARECSHVDFHVIPSAGHVPMLEAPAAFNQVLRRTLFPTAPGPQADPRPLLT